MTSAIDSAVPVAGTNLISKQLRDNFEAAKDEIEALQSEVEALEQAGGTGAGIPDATGTATYGRHNGAWEPVLPIEGTTLTGAMHLTGPSNTFVTIDPANSGGTIFYTQGGGVRFDLFDFHGTRLYMHGPLTLDLTSSNSPLRINNPQYGVDILGNPSGVGGGLLRARYVHFGPSNELVINEVGDIIFTAGSQFAFYGSPYFYGNPYFSNDVNFNNSNLTIQGSGTTTPTAKGNVVINSTNPLNGNLTVNGNAAGRGNIIVTQGNINLNQGSVTAYGGGLSANNVNSYNANFVNGNFYWGMRQGGGWGWVQTIGGSEAGALHFRNWDYAGPNNASWSMQMVAGELVIFPAALYNAGDYLNYGEIYGSVSTGSPFKCIGLSSPGSLTGGMSSQVFFTAYSRVRKSGGGEWEGLSDARTKTDVHEYTHGLSELIKLNPISYRYNGRAMVRETGKVYVGLAAEEALEVMPEMVSKSRGKLDYDGEETDILYLDATALAYATINALKDVEKRLSALETKIG